MTNGSPPNLIGVIRLSTVEQANEGKEGIGRQLDAIEKIRKETGANIIETIEIIESGAFVLDNPKYQSILDKLAQPGVDGVATAHVDRLVRSDSYKDFRVFEPYKEYGKRIWLPGHVIDPSSDSGWMETLFQGIFGGIEKKRIKERTMGAKEVLRRKGIPVMGWLTMPDGVLWDKENGWRYDLDPTAPPQHLGKKRRSRPGFALQVRQAFYELVVEGYSLRRVGQTLGGREPDGVRKLLSNRIWIGYRRYDREAGGKSRVSPLGRRYRDTSHPRAVILEVPVIEEPLIPVEMFERAQEILAKRAKEYGRRGTPANFLLGGIPRCSCGRPIYAVRRRRRNGRWDGYYYCSSMHPRMVERGVKPCGMRYIRADHLDRAVIHTLKDHLLTAEVIDAIVASNRKSHVPVISSERTRELTRIKTAEADLLDYVRTGDITRDEFRAQKRKLAAERVSIDARFPIGAEPWSDPTALKWTIAEGFDDLPDLPVADQRELLHRAVRRIMISGREILSLTLSGGFLDTFMATVNPVSKSSAPSLSRAQFANTPDLVVKFPKPVSIDQFRGIAA